jgi:uncharacterized protein YqgV (UPF0045/DUF77 family)
MNVTVEISMYPLTTDYLRGIVDFIEALNRHPELEVLTNPTSTQVFGDYATVMSLLSQEMQLAHESGEQAAFVMKVLGGDVRPVA